LSDSLSSGISEHLIVIERLFKFYKNDDKQYVILNDLSLKIKSGEIVGIMGPSGTGKTTLIKILAFIEPFNFGKVIIEGKDAGTIGIEQLHSYRSRKIGIIWQSFSNLFSTLTIQDNILFTALLSGMTYSDAVTEVQKVINEFSFENKAGHYPRELSGGEQQIAAILTQLVKKPRIILADEPTSRVDRKNTENILTILQKSSREKKTAILITTHDEYIGKNVDRCFYLNDGQLNINDMSEVDQ